MISFLICACALILGYVIYGFIVERVFAPDPARLTPAVSQNDGVDFIPMPTWKVFFIQLLNIAGTGPIFGAIAGALFGPSAFVWIVLGSIFAGAVHDYLSGMLSVRGGGSGLPEIVGKYLGRTTSSIMLVFCVLLLLMVGAVFVYSPASILGTMTGGSDPRGATMIWVCIVIVYYLIATLVPIDKIIGKLYPLFAAALLFMAISLFVCLIVKWPAGIPEFWDGLGNRNPSSGALFPCLFVSIACGAISGFHATQSPLMARCIKNEKLGRPIFYGSMITEGLIALIWAAVASYYFYGGGISDFGAAAVNPATGEAFTDAPNIVSLVCKEWLGVAGSILALLGVVIAPITSGDTALRSARLIIADSFKLNQKPLLNRLYICVPLFVITAAILWYSIVDKDGFNVIWRYFGWSNQTLACFTLWALTVFLAKERKGCAYLMTLVPAIFMTAVCISYIATAKIGFNLPAASIPWVAAATVSVCVLWFALWFRTRVRGRR